jgi:hypothetical protein
LFRDETRATTRSQVGGFRSPLWLQEVELLASLTERAEEPVGDVQDPVRTDVTVFLRTSSEKDAYSENRVSFESLHLVAA